jgi:hypothetical protein
MTTAEHLATFDRSIKPCPICGAEVSVSCSTTTDGRLIGLPCRDAFTVAQWLDDTPWEVAY